MTDPDAPETKPVVSPLRVSQDVRDQLKNAWHAYCLQCSQADPPKEQPTLREFMDQVIQAGIQCIRVII